MEQINTGEQRETRDIWKDDPPADERTHHTVIKSLAEQSKGKVEEQVEIVRMVTVTQGRTPRWGGREEEIGERGHQQGP